MHKVAAPKQNSFGFSLPCKCVIVLLDTSAYGNYLGAAPEFMPSNNYFFSYQQYASIPRSIAVAYLSTH